MVFTSTEKLDGRTLDLFCLLLPSSQRAAMQCMDPSGRNKLLRKSLSMGYGALG